MIKEHGEREARKVETFHKVPTMDMYMKELAEERSDENTAWHNGSHGGKAGCSN